MAEPLEPGVPFGAHGAGDGCRRLEPAEVSVCSVPSSGKDGPRRGRGSCGRTRSPRARVRGFRRISPVAAALRAQLTGHREPRPMPDARRRAECREPTSCPAGNSGSICGPRPADPPRAPSRGLLWGRLWFPVLLFQSSKPGAFAEVSFRGGGVGGGSRARNSPRADREAFPRGPG